MVRRPDPRKSGLVGLTILVLAALQTRAQDAADYSESVLEVVINEHDRGYVATILTHGDSVLVSEADLKFWRIVPPARPVLLLGGVQYYALKDLAPITYALDQQAQTLRLTVPVDSFVTTDLRGTSYVSPPLSPQVFSTFLNYDIAAGWSEDVGESFSGVLELAASDDWGLISATALGQWSDDVSDLVRLETFYLWDDPQDFHRLRLGDGITRSATWSTPVRFAGVQFGTNFGLQPNFISFPTPDFSDRAALPSVVEVYVNDALRLREDIDEGPFTLDQVPVVTGAGDVRFVVRDELGVERSFTAPYYVSSNLLRPGLSDYSVELGIQRDKYGETSFSYSDPFASGTYRYGINDWLTAEAHGEGSADAVMAGGGFNWVIPEIGEFGAFAAASGGDGLGALGRISFSRSEDWWSLGLSYQRATDNYLQVGFESDDLRVEDQLQATAGVAFGDFGSLSVSYTALNYHDGSDSRVSSVTYSVPILDFAYLNAFALRSESDETDPALTLGALVTVPLGERSSASVQYEDRDGSSFAKAEVRQDPPTDTGLGYRFAASHGDVDQQDADVTWRSRFGEFTAQLTNRDDVTGGRLLASGGFGYADETAFASRRITNGVGLVHVPGYGGVPVFIDNRLVAETNASGTAIIPDLRPYGDNKVSIDATRLPIDSKVGSDVIHLVPGARGAVVANFDVGATRGATFTVALPDGSTLPPGVSLDVGDRIGAAISGYDGTVFADNLAGGERISLTWSGGRCSFALDARLPDEQLPYLGTYVCGMMEQS